MTVSHLDQLPDTYAEGLYQHKCDPTYQRVFDSYYGEGRSVYSAPSG